MPKNRFVVEFYFETKKNIDHKDWDKLNRKAFKLFGDDGISTITAVPEEYTKTFDNAAERALKRIEEERSLYAKSESKTSLDRPEIRRAYETRAASYEVAATIIRQELKKYHGL